MGVIRRTIGAAIGVAAAALVATRLARPRDEPSDAPVVGTPGRYGWRHAEIFYARRGEGPPAILLHDVGPGLSRAEMAGLGDELARDFTVFTGMKLPPLSSVW